MMKTFLLAMVGAALIVSGCGSADGTTKDKEPEVVETPVATPEVEEVIVEFDADRAKDDYVNAGRCAGCHGEQLQGASAGAITGLTKDEVLLAIQEGPKHMPKNLITGEPAENLSAWIASHK